MNLFLEPTDVWLFRDGRPFDARSDHRAESLFPPFPTVIQGVLRSHHLVVQGIDLTDPAAIAAAVGTAEDFRALRMRGPFLAQRQGAHLIRYFPAPADAHTVKEGDEPSVRIKPATLALDCPPSVRTSAPTRGLLGLNDEPVKGQSDLWLTEEALHRYLAGQTVAATPAATLFTQESRFGIGLEPSRRTTAEGLLYEVAYVRLQPTVGLLVEVTGLDGWPSHGVLRIGGEGRAAVFEKVAEVPWPAPPDPLPSRFKVYLATPAYFTGGWQPDKGDWNRFFTGPVRLLAAAVGRYISLGGYDLARGEHKPARRYVPAGSVYYFEAEGKARLRPDLINQALTDWGAEIGFGQILIKEVPDV
jgi:CRISPR-associated protein Cmr3